MADDNQVNNNDFFNDEADEDLLSTIRHWTEKTQQENQARRAQQPQTNPDSRHISSGAVPTQNNPWAFSLTNAADRALQDPAPEGYAPIRPQAAAMPPAAAFPSEPKIMKEKPVKKKRSPRRVLAIVLAMVLLLGAGGYVFAFAMAGNVDSQPLDSEDRAALRAANGTSRVTNILVMGLDEDDGGRSDTMLLVSIDRVHRKLKLTSILRDCWVKLPNGKKNRINTAMFFGGPAMAMRTVSENFDVRVDHYVAFDFAVFEEIVDALGGVSVPITNKEADFMCKTAGAFKGKREEIRKQQEKKPDNTGPVKLNGKQALVFCRIRKLDSDFRRTERQRRFLDSLLSACARNPLRLLGLMGGALAHVKTDMTQFQMANLAAKAPLFALFKFGEDTMYTIPAEGTYRDKIKQGNSVIELDVDENAKRLKQFIYE